MGVLNKDNIPKPTLPKATVQVDSLGGEVVVRGLLLADRTNLFIASKDGNLSIPAMLACTVVDAADLPIFTEHEWDEFGAVNYKDSLKLFKKARELSGLNAEVDDEK